MAAALALASDDRSSSSSSSSDCSAPPSPSASLAHVSAPSASSPCDDEMMYIRKGVLDTVITQQQKRIAELERKLLRSKQEVLRLKALSATAAAAARLHLGVSTAASSTTAPRALHVGAGAHDAAVAIVDVSQPAGGDAALSAVTTEPTPPPPPPPPPPQTMTAATTTTAAAAAAAVAAAAAGQYIANGAVVRQTRGAVMARDKPMVEGQTRYWTADEHQRFLKGVAKFGPRNYTAIATFVKTRTPKQVRTHAQKYEMRLAREAGRKRAAAAETAKAVVGPGLEHAHVAAPDPATGPESVTIPAPAPAPAAEALLVKVETKPGVAEVTSSPMTDEDLKDTDSVAPTVEGMAVDDPSAGEFPSPDDQMDILADSGSLESAELLRDDVDPSVIGDDASGPTAENVLLSFGRSFSKSDLKDMAAEDDWLDM